MERVIGANIAADSLSSRENFRLFKDEGERRDLAINENNYYRCGVPGSTATQRHRKRGRNRPLKGLLLNGCRSAWQRLGLHQAEVDQCLLLALIRIADHQWPWFETV